MKQILISVGFCLVINSVFCQQYAPIDDGSSVKFTLKNFGFNTGGSFSGLKGNIVFDPANVSAAKFDVTIDAASINTENESRDGHLKKEDYFDVANYPHIHFVSSTITADKSGSYTVSGSLTIKKTTKEISFPFTATIAGDGIIFKGEFKINRRDFGVGGSSTLSDNVNLSLSVVAHKK